MVGAQPALTLYDAVLTLQGTTGGDDGNPTRTTTGSPITVKVDEIQVENSRNVTDAGTGQDEAEFNRTQKVVQRLTISTKLQKKVAADLQSLIVGTTGIVVAVTITATGANLTGNLIVEEHSFTYATPSTMRLVLRQYGAKISFTQI